MSPTGPKHFALGAVNLTEFGGTPLERGSEFGWIAYPRNILFMLMMRGKFGRRGAVTGPLLTTESCPMAVDPTSTVGYGDIPSRCQPIGIKARSRAADLMESEDSGCRKSE
jgi:hypothetical protein